MLGERRDVHKDCIEIVSPLKGFDQCRLDEGYVERVLAAKTSHDERVGWDGEFGTEISRRSRQVDYTRNPRQGAPRARLREPFGHKRVTVAMHGLGVLRKNGVD